MGDTGCPARDYWATIQGKHSSIGGRCCAENRASSEMEQNPDSKMNEDDDTASPSNNAENGYTLSIVSSYQFPGERQNQTPVATFCKQVMKFGGRNL